MSACMFHWTDILNSERHQQHTCTEQDVHRGPHVCKATYLNANGKMTLCGSARPR